MNMKKLVFVIFLVLFMQITMAFDVTNYVSLTGNHIPPYTNWYDAATNIKAALSESSSVDLVLVTNGTYCSSEIYLPKCYTLKSVNGPKYTIINAMHTNRGVYTKGTINGFTVTNGYVAYSGSGGGISCDKDGIVMNCIVVGNSAGYAGGGIDNYGIVSNSIITMNSSRLGGGGVYNCGIVMDSIISKNYTGTLGGGIYNNDIVENCVICNNEAYTYGGGVYMEMDTYLDASVYNSVIYENYGGMGGGCYLAGGGNLINCTICKNNAGDQSDGVYCNKGYDWFIRIRNCIIYAHKGEGLWFDPGFQDRKARIKNLAIHTKNCWFGSPPGFIDIKNNKFQLSRKSPCINKGRTNFYFALSKIGLAGNSRVCQGRIDIGAYEYNTDKFVKYKIRWNKPGKDKIIFKSKFKNYKNLGEKLSVKVSDNFIVSNLGPFKVTTKSAKYKSKNPKCIAKLTVKQNGILAIIKCVKFNKLDEKLNITNKTTSVFWRYIDIEYYLGTNMFTDKILTRFRSRKNKFCKGEKP